MSGKLPTKGFIMSVSYARAAGAASILAISASAGWADVTPQEVWADWKSYLSGVGYDVTATESSSGGELTVSNVSVGISIPDAQGNFSVTIPQIVLTDNGDGTVNVAFPAEFPVSTSVVVEGEDPVDIVLNYSHQDHEMTVSGTPEDMITEYSAASASVALASLTADGEQIPASVFNGSMTMTNYSTTTRSVLSDIREYSQALSADSLSYNMGFQDPSSDDQGSFTGNLQDVAFEGVADIPLEAFDSTDMRAMLDAGSAFDGDFSFGAGNSSMSGTGDGEAFAFESASQGGVLGVGMNGEHIAYDLLQEGLSVTISSGEIPFPLMLSMAQAGFNLAMPVAQTDEEQDFEFGIVLGDFTMPETLWGIFDPTAILPRDPATIIVDLSGKARMLFDILDPEAAIAMGDQPPGELNALTINELVVSAAGAEMTGKGDFTFDNSDLQSFDGMPAPSGKANLTLAGANALLDKLGQMGFIGDEEAMGARMMMGLLAVPGDAPDTLKSEIEITGEGHILANGQRIK
jgi:hypothetical protein